MAIKLPAALLGVLALAACATPEAQQTTAAAPTAAAQQSMAHVHMGHVLTEWRDTPENRGFLPTAVAEAQVAAQHAGFAAQRPDDLDWMQMPTRHVLHAVDPSVEAAGPGLGYGVRQAARGVADHIRFAADSEGASDNVKLHAHHVATSATNVVERVDEIVEVGHQILAAETAEEAAPLVARMEELAVQLHEGVDADGDGQITWEEGGLAQAEQHMGFMVQGEGMS